MSTSDEDPIHPDLVVQGGGLADSPGLGTEQAGDAPQGHDSLESLLGGGAGGAGGLDFGALLEQASNMQAQLLAAQEQAAETVIEGVSGGGAVRIEVTGSFEFRSVTISPDAVDAADVEMLQDLVLAALHDACDRVQELMSGSIDLGGLGGLLGGS